MLSRTYFIVVSRIIRESSDQETSGYSQRDGEHHYQTLGDEVGRVAGEHFDKLRGLNVIV